MDKRTRFIGKIPEGESMSPNLCVTFS